MVGSGIGVLVGSGVGVKGGGGFGGNVGSGVGEPFSSGIGTDVGMLVYKAGWTLLLATALSVSTAGAMIR